MHDAMLPRAAFKAQIRVDDTLRPLAPGETTFHTVKVKNLSKHPWPVHGKYPVHLSYHWLDKSGRVLVADGARTAFPGPIQPGQEVAVDCVVQAPKSVGPHQVLFDVVQEDNAWFQQHGSPPCRVPCEISESPPTFRLDFTGRCTEEEFRAAVARQDWWYHSYYFSNGFGVMGDYDIGRNIHEYGFPDDLTGMTVLDVGTGGGWFAHYLHQRGARVTAVDVRGPCDYDLHCRPLYKPVESEKSRPDRIAADGRPIYYSRVSGGFWVIQDLLVSDIRYVNARIYDLPQTFAGEKFDLVFVGALLLHLRDPIGALMACHGVCKDRLIATSRILVEDGDDPRPRMELWPQDAEWWYPNKTCYRRWFEDAGFRRVNVERAVTLTAEKPVPSTDIPGAIRNGSQRLQLADVHVV